MIEDEIFPFEKEASQDHSRREGEAPPSAASPITSLEKASPSSPGLPTAALEIERSRAVQEVQAMMIMAKRFPRDAIGAASAIELQCQHYALAEKAIYSYPRGKKDNGAPNLVMGPTIRLAEAIATAWGNLHYGFRELERSSSKVLIECFCWDMQTNQRVSRTVSVEFKMQLRGGKTKYITDPRDQYEHLANYAQRRVRSLIFECIPSYVREAAMEAVAKTLQKGSDKLPLAERLKKMTTAFQDLGITQKDLEKYLKHPIINTEPKELAELQGVFNAIRDGASREDYFDFEGAGGEEAGGKAAEVSALLASPSVKPK